MGHEENRRLQSGSLEVEERTRHEHLRHFTKEARTPRDGRTETQKTRKYFEK